VGVLAISRLTTPIGPAETETGHADDPTQPDGVEAAETEEIA